MGMDFPRGWQIARATPFSEHHLACSFLVTRGGILCDCPVITEHPEYTDDVLHGIDGVPCEPGKAVTP